MATATLNVQLSAADVESIADKVAARMWKMLSADSARQTKQEDNDLLTARDVQGLLNISRGTFYSWIKRGILPQGEGLKNTSERRWRRGDVMALLECKEQGGT